MVETNVIIKRKDYLRICEMLERIDDDLNTLKTQDNSSLIDFTQNKVTVIQNLLMEE